MNEVTLSQQAQYDLQVLLADPGVAVRVPFFEKAKQTFVSQKDTEHNW